MSSTEGEAMRLKYDLNIGALYIRLTDEPVARTQEIDDNTLVDLDEIGGVVGIEVVAIESPWALGTVLRDYGIPDDEAAQLRAYFQMPEPRDAAERTELSPELPEVSMNQAPLVAVAA
jgi:uncharacterized protein YuzE